jgi:hypothetical protein
VVHFHALHHSQDIAWGESDDHVGLDDTGLNTPHGDRPDTLDPIHILNRETEGFVGRPDWWLDGINGLEEGLSPDHPELSLFGPAFKPGHAVRRVRKIINQ